MATCAVCGGEASKVIYAGFPGVLCDDPECCGLSGAASWFLLLFPFPQYNEFGEPGWYWHRYEGAYLPALWRWLMNGKARGV